MALHLWLFSWVIRVLHYLTLGHQAVDHRQLVDDHCSSLFVESSVRVIDLREFTYRDLR